VLPMAVRGLGETEVRPPALVPLRHNRSSGGASDTLCPEETEAAIAARLHAEVDKLLN